MSAHDKSRQRVLRGAATHVQPRRLARPGRTEADADASAPGAPAVAWGAEDAGFAQGLEAGRAAGLEQGLAEGRARVDEAVRIARLELEQLGARRLEEFAHEASVRLAHLERIGEAFDGAVAERLRDLERDAIELAYAAICRIVGEQGRQPQVVSSLVRQALAQVRGSALLAIRLNEADLRALMADEQGRRLQSSMPQVKWLADASIAGGGCVVETTAGRLDARLETQLDALRVLWLQPQSPQPRQDGCATP